MVSQTRDIMNTLREDFYLKTEDTGTRGAGNSSTIGSPPGDETKKESEHGKIELSEERWEELRAFDSMNMGSVMDRSGHKKGVSSTEEHDHGKHHSGRHGGKHHSEEHGGKSSSPKIDEITHHGNTISDRPQHTSHHESGAHGTNLAAAHFGRSHQTAAQVGRSAGKALTRMGSKRVSGGFRSFH